MIDVDDWHASGYHVLDISGPVQRGAFEYDDRVPHWPRLLVRDLLEDTARIHERVLIRHIAVIDDVGFELPLPCPILVEGELTPERVAIGVLMRRDENAFGPAQRLRDAHGCRAIHLACVRG